MRIDDISDHTNIAQLTTEDPEGPCKFYNYLLLHPSRLYEIVPPYSIEKFRTFVESVFYVGKGTELRFLDHFKEGRLNNFLFCQVNLHEVIPLPDYLYGYISSVTTTPLDKIIEFMTCYI